MSKKILYTLEYPVRSSPTILFEFLSSGSALQEWFADVVDDRGPVYTFSWNGSEEKAEVLEKIENKLIRFRWVNGPKDEYFEFKIDKSEITNNTILVITDFAEKKDIKDQTQLWEYQVKELLHRIGS
ncbi:MAG: START-like domain-containing protein [Ferruginibacter sp.]|nr:ATPase [Ferruginibacter sp.]